MQIQLAYLNEESIYLKTKIDDLMRRKQEMEKIVVNFNEFELSKRLMILVNYEQINQEMLNLADQCEDLTLRINQLKER